VDDVAVALEHVDLLDRLDGLDVELLERGLQLLVIGAGALVDLLDLPARGAFASVMPISYQCTSDGPSSPYLLSSREHFGLTFSMSWVWLMAGLSRLEEFCLPYSHTH
jgi:hypothetical protein